LAVAESLALVAVRREFWLHPRPGGVSEAIPPRLRTVAFGNMSLRGTTPNERERSMPELLVDRIYDGYPDVALEMVNSRTFDGRIQLLEYVPTVLAGPPGTDKANPDVVPAHA
jgi:hypothetical protein